MNITEHHFKQINIGDFGSVATEVPTDSWTFSFRTLHTLININTLLLLTLMPELSKLPTGPMFGLPKRASRARSPLLFPRLPKWVTISGKIIELSFKFIFKSLDYKRRVFMI